MNAPALDPRPSLRLLLSRHEPADAKEASDLRRMLEFAETLRDPLSREQLPAHFTASALVLDRALTGVCLIHHKKLGRWLQPGGHLEPEDEGALDVAARREVLEETGLHVVPVPSAPAPLDVDIHTIPGRPELPEHEHLDVRFLLRAEGESQLAFDPAEALGARLLPWDEALALPSDPAFQRMLRKALRIARAGRAGGETPGHTAGT